MRRACTNERYEARRKLLQPALSLMFQKSKSSRQMVELGNFSALFETSRAKTER